MRRLRLPVLLAGGALAAMTALGTAGTAMASPAGPAHHAIAATGTVLRDGDGVDEGIANGSHNTDVNTGGSEAFLEVNPSGSYFELEGQTNAQCLTVDTSLSDEVLWETCGGSEATMWSRSGELYKSELTGEPLYAQPTGFCTEVGAVFSKGGEPVSCSNSWNTVS